MAAIQVSGIKLVVGQLVGLLASVIPSVLQGVDSRDRSSKVRVVGPRQRLPELALRVLGRVESQQFFG